MGPHIEEDFEAQSAVDTLQRAEQIKQDRLLMLRVSDEIEKRKAALESISEKLPQVLVVEPEEDEEMDPSTRLSDFFNRFQKHRRKIQAKELESPEHRRQRLKASALTEKVSGSRVLTKFT